jgi:hypothetical protein
MCFLMRPRELHPDDRVVLAGGEIDHLPGAGQVFAQSPAL